MLSPLLRLSGRFQPTLPARGATAISPGFVTCTKNFNPRSPHGERLSSPTVAVTIRRFQPTLPARGATTMPLSFFPTHPFQPTLPARGATFPSHEVVKTGVKISTHAPRTGSDHLYAIGKLRLCIISTHAPRTGSDYKGFRSTGERSLFQPTLPARGATRRRSTACVRQRFQPTLPARGATINADSGAPKISTHFNPRSPHGERPHEHDADHCPAHFNPRSPHGERPYCDRCGQCLD